MSVKRIHGDYLDIVSLQDKDIIYISYQLTTIDENLFLGIPAIFSGLNFKKDAHGKSKREHPPHSG